MGLLRELSGILYKARIITPPIESVQVASLALNRLG